MKERITAHPVASFFTDRWSPRAYTDEEIPNAILFACFEAARWAPSGFNLQPWRLIYATRGGAGWTNFLDFLSGTNRSWASNAAALVLFTSWNKVIWNGKELPATSNSFDTGAAWSHFAHQAILLGWHTHAMGGFDREMARAALSIPEDFTIEAVVAIGRIGDSRSLPLNLRERELPSGRRPLAETVMAGRWVTL